MHNTFINSWPLSKEINWKLPKSKSRANFDLVHICMILNIQTDSFHNYPIDTLSQHFLEQQSEQEKYYLFEFA